MGETIDIDKTLAMYGYMAVKKETYDAMLEALEMARQFIRNGVEYGYIVMPDEETPDPAHKTLPAIEAAIAKAKREA